MKGVHFIGIGGVGMNGLAQLAVHAGWKVSGSDRAADPDRPPFSFLRKMGVHLFPQNGSGVETASPDLVVYSTAIEPDNPDLEAAESRGIPCLHRAEFLARLIGNAELIAVAGTAGKSTVTGMIGRIFEEAGYDPTVYNGAAVLDWKKGTRPSNVRSGRSDLWIIEADESDRSFLRFHPAHAVVTNIARDHFDLPELRRLFARFREQVSGHVVEGPGDFHPGSSPRSFLYQDIEFRLALPGRHNLLNALCAVRLCEALGIDLHLAWEVLTRFRGIERRMEIVSHGSDITVIDDYAHNPFKISAALSAAGELAAEKEGRLFVYWRPHGFTPLANMIDELPAAFAAVPTTAIFILPVYYAGGTVRRTVSAEELVRRLRAVGLPASFVPDYSALEDHLERKVRSGDVILGMGARDPELPRFARHLVEKWRK